MTGKRAVAVLAILGGTFEIANAGIDVMAGGGGQRDATWQLSITLAVLLGAAMLGAGIALLRGGQESVRWARGAALVCLALIVSLQLVFPFMSIFSRLVGVAIPVALLLVARRSSGPSVPSMV